MEKVFSMIAVWACFFSPVVSSAFLFTLCAPADLAAFSISVDVDQSCFINRDAPVTVYNSTTMQLRDCSGKSGYSNLVTCPLIQFDLSSLPQDIVINSASMILVVQEAGNVSIAYETAGVHRVLSDWSETTTTWSSRPSYDQTPSATIARREAGVDTLFSGEEVSVDITSLAQGWYSGAVTNQGVFLAMSSGEDWGRYIFYSDEASESLRPKLVVEYSRQITIPLSQDTYVFKSAPSSTYGDQGVINAWDISAYSAYSNTVREMLMQIDLGDLPFGAVIQNAQLNVTVNNANHDQAGLEVRMCENAWDEGLVCWTNRPLLSDDVYEVIASRSAPAVSSIDSYDITEMVQAWQVGTVDNCGFCIRFETNTQWGTLGYYSSEWPAYAPLVTITYTVNTFDVQDYGATGNGLVDDTAAIAAALAAAENSSTPAEVFLPAGTYKISSTNEYALTLDGVSDICLKGEGSNTVLLVSNPENGGVGVLSCTNILLEGFTVDYDPVPFTQGTITAVDTSAGTFDLQIDSGYLELDDPCFISAPQKWGLAVDLSREAYDVWAYFSSSWSNLGSRVWRMSADDPSYLAAHPLSIGDRYAHMARRYDAYAVGSFFCDGIRLRNVSVHAAAALSTGWKFCSGVDIDGLQVIVKPNSGRLIAANGDGIHSAGCSDGLRIENCVFDGLPDDAINIHGRGGLVIQNVSDTVKRIGLPRTPTVFEPGDEVQIYFRGGGGFTNATVISSAMINDVVMEVEFDRALPNLAASWGSGDKVSNASRCGEGSLIANNYFGTQRGRGILLRSREIMIRDNYFRNPSLAGMAVDLRHEDWSVTEGPVSKNITILNNTIEGGTNQWSWSGPWVSVRSYIGSNGNDAATYDTSGVMVESNLFVDIDGPAVSAGSAQDVYVVDNEIDIGTGLKTVVSPSVFLTYAENVMIDGLKIRDLNSGTYAGIHITDTVSDAPGAVIVTNLDFVLSSGSVDVQDDR